MRLLTLTSRIAGMLLLALVAGIILSGLSPAMAQGLDEKEEKDDQEAIVIGDIPPDFTIVDMAGNEFTLSEMVGVKPVILDFWATWCPPCRLEIPVLNEFAALHMDDVMVVGITSEAADSEQDIRDFAEENDLVYCIIQDPSGEISASYFVTGIPFLVVIDIDGVVVSTHIGYDPEMDLITELEEELGLEGGEVQEEQAVDEDVPAETEETEETEESEGSENAVF